MKAEEKLKIVIITGLSGAGKTHAADWFEDHGYYCIDNMPPALIKTLLSLASFQSKQIMKAAFVVDIRSDDFLRGLSESIDFLKLRSDIEFSILFVEASDATLIKRYNETRRTHPLATGRTSREVIERERELLADLRARANYVLDTTNLKVAEFSMEMERLFSQDPSASNSFGLNFMSFGYKYGVPQETDMVFDVRFIPNPYYLDSLRKLTGNNQKVQKYVLKHEITQKFIEQLREMVHTIAPFYIREGKNHLNIAFGCTGGQHRSVTLANEMARIFEEEGYRVTLEHREL